MGPVRQSDLIRQTQAQLFRAELHLGQWQRALAEQNLAEASAFAQGAVLALMLAYRLWLQELLGETSQGIRPDSAIQALQSLAEGQPIPELEELAQLEADPAGWPAELMRAYRSHWFFNEPQQELIVGSPAEGAELTAKRLCRMVSAFKALAERFRQAQTPY